MSNLPLHPIVLFTVKTAQQSKLLPVDFLATCAFGGDALAVGRQTLFFLWLGCPCVLCTFC
jgi:hypothetical protein